MSSIALWVVFPNSSSWGAELLSEHASAALEGTVGNAVLGPTQTMSFFRHAYSDRLGELQDTETVPLVQRAAQAFGAEAQKGCDSNGKTLQGVYKNVVQSAQWSQDLLSSPERQQLAEATRLLWKEPGVAQDGYANYLQYKQALDAAQNAFNALPPAKRGAQAANAVSQAQSDLDTLGERTRYASADASYAHLSKLSVNNNRQAYHRLLARTGAVTRPKISTLVSQYTIHTLLVALEPSDQTPWSGPNLQLRFDTALLQIQRSWLIDDLLAEDSWKWPSGTSAAVLSDGDGGGELGKIVDRLVVVRNVRIGVASVKSLQASIAELPVGEERVTLGPFVILSREATTPPFTANFDAVSNEISIPDVTIFGCSLRDLPKAPNPNPDYKW